MTQLHRFIRWFLALAAALLAACASDPTPIRVERFVFGTRVELTVVTPNPVAAEEAIAEISALLVQLHHNYHAWEPSELTAVNEAIAAGQPAPLLAELALLLTDAKRWTEASDRLFDPGIGALISLWGFHQSDFATNRPPAPDAVAALLAQHPSLADVTIMPGIDGTPCAAAGALQANAVACLTSANRAVRLDLGGYLKGYALDRAAAILLRHGITNALINIGGNILALGQPNRHRPWRVALHHPRLADPLPILPLYDGEAIGTSGDYQRYYLWEGVRYHHLIDPRTGAPSQGAQAVTVVIAPRPDGRTGLLSDVATKPLFLAGEAWFTYAARWGITHVLRVAPDGSVTVTAPLRQRLTWVAEPERVTVIAPPAGKAE